MLSPVTKIFGDFSVHFRPLPATAAFTLAKRVGSALLPIVKTLDLSDLSADVDVDKLIDAATQVLSEISDDTAVGILVDSLAGSTITAPGQPPTEIQSRKEIDVLFSGELETLYQIVFESWKYNKLAPFKFAARFGLSMKKTDTSSEAANTETKFGQKLALSGNSIQK